MIALARKGALSPARALLYGTLTVGTLDLLDAIIFFGLRSGVFRPVRVCQSIASGLLGRSAFEGGAATAALGLALHFFIAFVIVAAFFLVSRRMTILRRHPFVVGPLYGLVVYVVMNDVVIPLSAIGSGTPPPLDILINGLLIHAFGVGLPSALFARAAGPAGAGPAS